MRTGQLLILAVVVASLIQTAFGQNIIRGVVIDSTDRQPIAFANVTLDDGRTGTSTDIEGSFSLTVPANYSGAVFVSHVAYQRRVVSFGYLKQHASISLIPAATILNEIAVTASKEENPAFRIIRQAVAHKKEHDPDQLKSYSYISYNKYLITLTSPEHSFDSTLAHIKKKDSTKQAKARKTFVKFDSLLNTTHLFLSESITETKKINPDREKEKLLALQVSGFKSPIFTNVATDYQPFSFYKDNISLLGKDFLNPVSKGTFSRYDFMLRDTAYQGNDTIFIIRYSPKPHSFFNGLKGVLSITTDGFAIKNVVAASADSLALTGIRIQQNYEKLEGKWFPVQLNTDMHFYKYDLYGRHAIAQHKSFLQQIQINPELNPSEFGDVKVELSLPKASENKLVLDRYRTLNLDHKELRTFSFTDSVTRKVRWMDYAIEALVTQAVPFGIFEFNLNKLLKVNRYEGSRLGGGIYTNNRFSRWLRLGGYAGYGFKDEQWKYGGDVRFNFNQNKDLFLQFSYAKDIYETGSSHYNREGQITNESLRTFVSSQYDRIEFYKGEIGYRLMPDVHIGAYVSRSEISPTYNYQLLFDNELINKFVITEAGVTIRYVKDESYMTLRGKRVFLGQRFPVFTFSVAQAAPWFDAQNFNYTRFDFTSKIRINHRYGGKTRFFFTSGWLNGLAPYGKLYNGRGANLTSYFADDYFQTMGLYEFTVSKYASMFLNHNFGNILLNKKYSKPEFVLYHNMGIGQLDNANVHSGLTIQDFSKGFIESGVGMNNILRSNYFNVAYWGMGGAIFYRYGPYQLASPNNNLFYKLTISFSF